MGWPQITWIALVSVSLLISANQHGKPKTGTNHFGYAVAAAGIHVTLLWFGGFFGGAA